MLVEFCQSELEFKPLPVIIVKDDKTTITTSKGNLVALVVPPVGMRLSVDHITENDHVPNWKYDKKCNCTVLNLF